MLLLHDSTVIAFTQRVAAGFVIATAIVAIAYRLRSLARSGAVAALLLGALTFGFGGLLVAAALVLFFMSGSVLSRIRNPAADEARSRSVKDARRDSAQVLANGGIATACAIVGGLAAAGGWPSASRWMIAAVCALAAVCGDTWSTEIGAFFRGRVRLITNLRPVDAGTSGGITPLGIIAAPLGGAFVCLAGSFRPDLLGVWAWVSFGAVAGLVGSAFDSILGASAQGVWRCSRCGQLIESAIHKACSSQATLVRGLPWLDNDGVNGLASLSGAALGFLMAGLT